ncbi:MAG: hypothetical protein ACOX3V_05300 [Bacillota bacterium]|jgi:hypothetical protein
MNAWERMSRLDARCIYLLLTLVLVVPLLKPWNLPVPISPMTVAYKETLESLAPGKIIGIAADYRSDTLTELNPILQATFRQVMGQGNKVIIWALIDEGANVSQAALEPIAEELGKVYGTDWINLGYKPGTNVTLQKMIDDLDEGAGYTDLFGKTLRDYPIMQGITSLTQMDMVIVIPSTTLGIEPYMTMLTIPNKIPLLQGCASGGATNAVNLYKADMIKGAIAGLRGAAEYEKLLDVPGLASAATDAQSAAHVLMIVLIGMANLVYFMNRRAKSGGGR